MPHSGLSAGSPLWVDDVEAGTRKLPGLQCGNQVLNHDTTAARCY
jgi:hypothetical protein